jgi:ComF family protein
MIDTLLSLIAPHHCCGCGKIGLLLCDNCKYDIISEPESVCLACGGPCGPKGICGKCHVSYIKGWSVGKRQDTLQRLVGLYKFERVKAGYRVLATLLSERVPELPSDVVVVPIPTVAGHIRERGYDHTLLIARSFAKSRGLRLSQALARSTHTKQRQATATTRTAQAKVAFNVPKHLTPDVPYLLIDDVMTTGATVKYAAKALKQAGASQVWVAIIARQTLD